jgi:hypothetical protein
MPAGNRAPAPLRWLFFMVLMGIIVALWVHAAWFWFPERERAHASGSWPSVDGVFERRPVANALDSSRYAAYRYVVDGKTYQGFREGFAYKDGPLFDPGAAIKVYVDPNDPASSVLYPGESDKFWPVGTAAGLSVLLGLFAWGHRPWPRGKALISGGYRGETNWLPFIVCFLVMAGSWVFLGFWAREQLRGRQSESWPAVAGTIQQAGSTNPRASYKLSTIYRYEVDGRAYRGERVRFAWGSRNPYDKGQAVTVYVNPADPTDAVLYPGTNWSPWWPLFIGFWLVLGSVLCWVFWPPWGKEKARASA